MYKARDRSTLISDIPKKQTSFHGLIDGHGCNRPHLSFAMDTAMDATKAKRTDDGYDEDRVSLDDDDLDLIEQNMKQRRRTLKRLKRGGDAMAETSASAAANATTTSGTTSLAYRRDVQRLFDDDEEEDGAAATAATTTTSGKPLVYDARQEHAMLDEDDEDDILDDFIVQDEDDDAQHRATIAQPRPLPILHAPLIVRKRKSRPLAAAGAQLFRIVLGKLLKEYCDKESSPASIPLGRVHFAEQIVQFMSNPEKGTESSGVHRWTAHVYARIHREACHRGGEGCGKHRHMCRWHDV